MSNEKMKREKRMAKRRKDRNIEITLFNVDKTLSRKFKLQVFQKETVTNQANSKRRLFYENTGASAIAGQNGERLIST